MRKHPMFAVIVQLQIDPSVRERFLEEMFRDARESRAREADCHAFHIVEVDAVAGRYGLFEIYTDEAAFAAHQETPHFKRWIAAVTPWLREPLQITTGARLCATAEGV